MDGRYPRRRCIYLRSLTTLNARGEYWESERVDVRQDINLLRDCVVIRAEGVLLNKINNYVYLEIAQALDTLIGYVTLLQK